MKALIVVLSFSIAALSFVQGPTDNSRAASRNEPQEASTVPFKDFDAQIEVLGDAEFEVRGSFTLGETSNGINLFKEDVTLEVGTFSKNIPAGSFKQVERGKVKYKESEGEVELDLLFRITGNNMFAVKLDVKGVKLTKQVKAEDITLKIGDDQGRARERVK